MAITNLAYSQLESCNIVLESGIFSRVESFSIFIKSPSYFSFDLKEQEFLHGEMKQALSMWSYEWINVIFSIPFNK